MTEKWSLQDFYFPEISVSLQGLFVRSTVEGPVTLPNQCSRWLQKWDGIL